MQTQNWTEDIFENFPGIWIILFLYALFLQRAAASVYYQIIANQYHTLFFRYIDTSE